MPENTIPENTTPENTTPENSAPNVSCVIIVHHLEHARVALQTARNVGAHVTLQSPPTAAMYLGVSYIQTMFDTACAEIPPLCTCILDCGSDPAIAMEAMASGCTHIRINTSEHVLAKLNDIAMQSGCTIVTGTYDALDLHNQADIATACQNWFTAI